ncbi:hypothetical protein B0T17DRAFT_519028 [Bombardia bombarda]|uniref:Uncharacterized protein n=1 Tax=Bombardia bombarda TaxID=252184 RepID=A0AA39XLT4_9PEZI|nr:hypothetical protein B0T17DRAFT_519028 [Bombardia bombarda]
MFHQLHCLGMMREAYYSAVQGRNSTIFAEASLTEKQRQSSRRQHIGHCFDYIRQAIMCGGDMTLEWAKEPDPGRERETVDGWGITHQCRNFDQGLDWVKKHKAPFDHDGIA